MMKLQLVFETQELANIAQEQIATNMDCGIDWDTPRQRITDNKWFFELCHDNVYNMKNVRNIYAIEEFEYAWLPQEI